MLRTVLTFIIVSIISCKQPSKKVEAFRAKPLAGVDLDQTISDADLNSKIEYIGMPEVSAERRIYELAVRARGINGYAVKFGESSELSCQDNIGYEIKSKNESYSLNLMDQELGYYKVCVIVSFQLGGWQNKNSARSFEFSLNEKKSKQDDTSSVIDPPKEVEEEESYEKVGSCEDELPPTNPDYSCEQKEWGKCSRDWMQGYCKKSCGRC